MERGDAVGEINMRAPWKRLLRTSKGATAIEYALIAGGIAVVIAATVFMVGTSLNTQYVAVENVVNK